MKKFILFFLGILLCTGIVYFAASYSATVVGGSTSSTTSSSSQKCVQVPRCSNGTNTYSSYCYSMPSSATAKLIINTPVLNTTNSMTLPVSSSGSVTSSRQFYIPDIDGYIFKGYYYGGSKIVDTRSLKFPIVKSSITGTRCVFNGSSGSSYSIASTHVSVSRGFSTISLESKWEVADYELILYDTRANLDSSISSSGAAMSFSGDDSSAMLPIYVGNDNGYVFEGWYYDEGLKNPVSSNLISELNFSKTYTSYGTNSNVKSGYKPLKLYSKWKIVSESQGSSVNCPTGNSPYKVVYNTNGGNKLDSYTHCGGCRPTTTSFPIPERKGYEFDGWYYDSLLKTEVTQQYLENVLYTPKKDSNGCTAQATVNLYAKWKKIEEKKPTIVVDSNKNEDNKKDENKNDNNKDDTNKKPNNDECLKDIRSYKIIYNTNGGVNIENFVFCSTCNYVVSNIPKTVREDYEFDGWYYDAELTKKVEVDDVTKVDFEQAYDENGCVLVTEVNLYAKWNRVIEEKPVLKKEYTVVYETNGGSSLSNELICYNCDNKTELVLPKKNGFKFAGWYYDEYYSQVVSAEYLEELGEGFVLAENDTITLYAKWEMIEEPSKKSNFSIINILIIIIVILLFLVFLISIIKKAKNNRNNKKNNRKNKKEPEPEIEILGL